MAIAYSTMKHAWLIALFCIAFHTAAHAETVLLNPNDVLTISLNGEVVGEYVVPVPAPVLFKWTPSADQAGAHEIEFCVYASDGAKACENVDITVTAP